MTKSSSRAMRWLARTYPLLAPLAEVSPEIQGSFRWPLTDADSERCYDFMLTRIRTHGLSCGGEPSAASVPPLSEELMRRLSGRKVRFRKGPIDDAFPESISDAVYKTSMALSLAALLPAEWFPDTQAGFETLVECGELIHEMTRDDGHNGDGLLLDAMSREGWGLTIATDDLRAMFRTSGEMRFEHPPVWKSALIVFRDTHAPNCNYGALLDRLELLAVYAVKLAGLETEFVEWQVAQKKRLRRKGVRDLLKFENCTIPRSIHRISPETLIATMVRDGFRETFASAADYCADLKVRIRSEVQKH
jgi:hypothetical protein